MFTKEEGWMLKNNAFRKDVGDHRYGNSTQIRRGGYSVSPCCSRWAGFVVQLN